MFELIFKRKRPRANVSGRSEQMRKRHARNQTILEVIAAICLASIVAAVTLYVNLKK
jgi:hypothetical protein